MQAVANWLVARPYNSSIWLAATLMLPVPQMFSGALIVLLVLARGPRFTALAALIAVPLAALIIVFRGGTLQLAVLLAVWTWVPALLLTYMLMTLRSLTLTVQVTAILAIAGYLLFGLLVPDAAAFWQPYMELLSVYLQERGLELNTELIPIEMVTLSVVLVIWFAYVGALLLGNSLYSGLSQETLDLGSFQDFSFGRVIAMVTALISLLAFVSGAAVLTYVAAMLFVMFILQGFALIHWLYGAGHLPGIAVVAVYVLLPLLQVLLVPILAVIGYTDAWISIRRRFAKS